MNFDSKTSFITNLEKFLNLSENWRSSYLFAKNGFCTFCHFWTGLSLVILINLGFRQKTRSVYQYSQNSSKNQSGKIPKSLKNQELQKSSKLVLVVLIETLLYFCMCVNCVLTEHLAEWKVQILFKVLSGHIKN